MISLTIKEIASMINGTLYINEADENDLVNGVVIDSREVQKGNLYVPIVGMGILLLLMWKTKVLL